MPEISRFLGICIFMYFNEHNPPHFHIRYNEFRAVMTIEGLEITEGRLPSRVAALVLEWASQHRGELMDNWNSIRETGDYNKIEPLV